MDPTLVTGLMTAGSALGAVALTGWRSSRDAAADRRYERERYERERFRDERLRAYVAFIVCAREVMYRAQFPEAAGPGLVQDTDTNIPRVQSELFEASSLIRLLGPEAVTAAVDRAIAACVLYTLDRANGSPPPQSPAAEVSAAEDAMRVDIHGRPTGEGC